MTQKQKHNAFLLRWQEEADHSSWRAMVENAYTGEKTHFASKLDLLRYLWQSLYGESQEVSRSRRDS